MNLLQLEYFCEIAKLESYTRAAAKLNVAQPSLSRAVKKLEEELRAELFKRAGRSVVLTAQGRDFFERTAPALEAIKTAREKLLAESGKLRLRLLVLAASAYMRGFYSIFVKKHPEVSLHLLPQNGENDWDACIASPEDNIPGRGAVLLEEKMFLAVAKGHPLAEKKRISLKELEPYPFVMYNRGYSMRSVTDRILSQAGVAARIAYECDNNASFVSVLASGEAVGLAPEKTMPNILTGEFARIEIEEDICERKVLLYRKSKNKAADIFKKECAAYFKKA